ncbi:hypothetical protein K0T92_20785 [Paenibacillus oenotherae]|uniref:Uncharacterized protein n=1 Tax=Paenibacillus oenotherae TaxID=1435645 RepID=A0ABS7DC10_9BACL|nr:hypothetical protein [Paenibacillus oenotherae]MBW7477156.1 hypothetical protein [Paenibacillus oenotherae]
MDKLYARSLKTIVWVIVFLLSLHTYAQLMFIAKVEVPENSPNVSEKYDVMISYAAKQRDGAYSLFLGSILSDKFHSIYHLYLLILSAVLLYPCIAIRLKHLLLDPIKYTSNFVIPSVRHQS